MVNEATADAPISQAEIDAVKEQLLANVNLDELKGKNSAVLTVMMPLPLRVMIDEAARNTDGSEGSAADWARQLFATQLDYTLPTKTEVKSKRNKRDVEVQQKAQRAMVAELIERARKGEIDL
jgi:cytochrome P450